VENPSEKSSPRLHLRIRPTAEWKLRSGHPWLYESSILDQNRPGQIGELAIIYDRYDNFLAIGLFDPDSPIRVRILAKGKPQPIDAAWFRERLQQSLHRRDGLFDAQTTGFRCINGESDGWPGLALDIYDKTLVLKIYTAAWLPWLRELKGILSEELFGERKPERLVLRLSRNIQSLARKRFDLEDGQILEGTPLSGPVIFLESGLRFEADVLRGQKTGFFLDQRENRRRVESLARGRRVLNAFSFSGGFSVYAARGGAVSVTDLDISTHALEAGARNFDLNDLIPTVAACRREAVRADAFDWLRKNARPQFDLVILDPPSLAKKESERDGAIHAYGQLARHGIACVRPGGILVTASCSAHVSAPEFFEAVREAARQSKRPWKELETTGHPPDHPAAFAEANYLKCIFLEC
jgi:23S rRNA (cytosine1962-C5)-methyltransferase